ncbi:MAG TPA: twin-arginine translocation signal domain-containing protein, partial [Thermomicrobiales bacterium]|nr:twin-arginine translocation signal domain-containing protein [Thermomicrobiales bacterium]
MNERWIDALTAHLQAGHLSRRDFVKRATVLGLSAPAISAILVACGGSSEKATSTTAPSTGGTSATPTSGGVTINQNVTPTAASGWPR